MAQRGRKKGSNGEESRALLLRIAADEFAENGYYETKISDIVKKAEVTQPTFYLYFKSKEAIFEELEDLFRARLSSLTMNSLLEEGLDEASLPERIADGLSAIFHFFAENRSLGRIGFYISPLAADIKAQMADQIEQNLFKEAKSGYFHENADMGIVAASLVGAIEYLTAARLWTGANTADELAKEVVSIILYGLKK
ncbi:TetR/AcrR family transcriptional regulator [Domibacillus indicus]|uniref:TetR/AcrR family transcriptional regulator n=1 Tax=Domibacillus indicus TaxID=1437523 RepID=UPI000617FC41|nr:TetR/AcrR family transcriptional regulator [Domibacillus indicus]